MDYEKFAPHIAVVGLGYVGLPLAISLAKYFPTIGFDIDTARINSLTKHIDITNTIAAEELQTTALHITDNIKAIAVANVYIITLPTPIDENNKPNLTILKNASISIAGYLDNNNIIVYESTVYPGVTENICKPLLEEFSNLSANENFYLGYSPERINPGDKIHTIDKITKVVAAENSNIANILAMIYGKINNNNIHIAPNIKTAEAAKVIENSQRDINVAFINEVAQIAKHLQISIYDILAAANTKWNFLNFSPGLVGGHCIGVDPYYLASCAQKLGHEPKIILSGRNLNESMPKFIASCIHEQLHLNKGKNIAPQHILILGLTFKEDIPDLRNTKIVQIINELVTHAYKVDVHDPLADPKEANDLYKLEILTTLDVDGEYDCIVGAVPHEMYCGFTEQDFVKLLKPQGLVIDIKNIWSHINWEEINYWKL